MNGPVAVLLYPGCIFFEIALAAETLAERGAQLRWFTPDGSEHAASNGARIAADGAFAAMAVARPAAVLVPGGDPRSILLPHNLAREPLEAARAQGALLAGICAGNLVLAASGLLRGRRGTHNYTAEFAPPEKVAATAPHWAGMTYVRADVVDDGPVITAQPWAYRAWAAAVGERLGLLAPPGGRASAPLRAAHVDRPLKLGHHERCNSITSASLSNAPCPSTSCSSAVPATSPGAS